MAQLVLSGFLAGFLGSIPLAGPISVLVLGRGLDGAYRSGLFLSFGAALAEGAYAFGACWGLGTLLERYAWLGLASQSIAAVILVALGCAFALRHGRDAPAPRMARGRSSFALGFVVAALNPTLIATWTAAVATLHGVGVMEATRSAALPFALGVTAGIAGWFALLLELLRRHRHRFNPVYLRHAVRAMGVVLVVMGIWLGSGSLRSLWHG